MKIGRRGFLRGLGGVAVATIAAPIIARTAPLFIPPERLAMGVPRALIAPEPFVAELTDADFLNAWQKLTGIQDDTAFLQGLIDRAAARGGDAWVPPGVYHTRRTLEMRSGVLIRGEGATLNLEAATGVHFAADVSNAGIYVPLVVTSPDVEYIAMLDKGATGNMIDTMIDRRPRDEKPPHGAALTMKGDPGVKIGTW